MVKVLKQHGRFLVALGCSFSLPAVAAFVSACSRRILPSSPGPPCETAPVAISKQYEEDASSTTPPDLVKFPRTSHLLDMGAATPDDIIVDQRALDSVLRTGRSIVVEEKLDGANMGISCDDNTGKLWVQNRGHFVDAGEHAQFDGLPTWLEAHETELYELLEGSSNYVLYGEWLAARHSIPYQKLPGLFVAFDLYDKSRGRFLSRRRFHAKCKEVNIIPVAPVLRNTQNLSMDSVMELLESKSAFRTDSGPVEGICLRVDDEDDRWLQDRFKIVRGDFTAGISTHWSKRKLERNMVDYSFSCDYRKTCFSMLDSIPTTKNDLAEREKRRRRVPRCIMLMGLPGSGKSSFAELLGTTHDNWIIVNQDTLGRKQALTMASKATRRTRVILDRCHTTENERSRWWKAMNSPPKGHVALVYFATTADECASRVVVRKDHPTIPNDARGASIVRSIERTMEPPTLGEQDLFGTIEVVSSIAQANQLLRSWGVDI